ncbi:MAG TPA: SRPBCC family protein [Anaeromyxobacteraceae bacterium]|nr:SRPBCC family protein [Anaeromyxobacteraceae bacterium]
MAIAIEERFVVRAPTASVWEFLVDPLRVVTCVPGGALEEVADERTYRGRIRVQIGPFTMTYGGRVRLAEVDATARRVKIIGEAVDRSGADTARLTLHSWLATLPGGATEVVAQAEVEVGGRPVELGRGFLEHLGHEFFREFSDRVRAAIESEEAARAARRAGEKRTAPRPVGAAALRALPILVKALRSWIATFWRPRRP